MKLLAPLALLALLLILVVTIDDTPQDADLVFVNQNETFTLDPQRMSYIQDLRLAQSLYEGLVRWDNHDFSVQPAGATSWTVSPDRLTYRFTLRPEAVWSNGDPVTSHDFVYAWRRAILPDTAADYTNLFFSIRGAESFFSRRVARTGGFVADPWSGDDGITAATVELALGRLERLLAAGDTLPAAIAHPDPAQLDTTFVELETLRSAVSGDHDQLFAVDLANATVLRAWHERLDEAESRAAEAQWMWAETLADFDRSVGLRAPDDHHLEITLERPTAYLLDLMCFGVFFPVHQPTVEGWPAGTDRATPPPFADRQWLKLDLSTGRVDQRHGWARPEYHVGNGPYLLTQWRYKRDLRLDRNPTYHDQSLLKNDSILALTIEDTNTAVLAFESGRVDWLVDVSTDYEADMVAERIAYEDAHRDELDRLLADGLTLDEALAALPAPGPGERRNIHMFPTFGTSFFSFNCRKTLSNGDDNPFHLAAVRRAFTLAVDKREIVDRVTRLREPVATTLIPLNSIPGYTSPAGLPFDRDRARAELAAAGWTDRDGDGLVEDHRGHTFPVIDLLYTTNIPRYKWICLNLKAQWESSLGVQIELRPAETKFYKEDLKLGQFMIARGRWYGDYGDPTTFLELCRTTDGNNDRGYSNPKVDAWLSEAADESDPDRRRQILETCEAFLMDKEVPMMPLYQLTQVYMYKPGTVRGLSAHPRLTQFLWQMEVQHP